MKKVGQPPVTVKRKLKPCYSMPTYRAAVHVDTVESIRRGLAQARKGAGRSINAVFKELEREDLIR